MSHLWWKSIPFVIFLLSITLLPAWKPKFWQNNFHKLVVAVFATTIAFFMLLFYKGCYYAFFQLFHTALFEYAPFVLFIAFLYGLSAQISFVVRGSSHPIHNTLFLLLAGSMANILGTVGASLICLQPFLKLNKNRTYKAHNIIFFIYCVGNIGGGLSSLGDPPLLMGYLHGLPFYWPTVHLWKPWLLVMGLLLLTHFIIDTYFYRKEKPVAYVCMKIEKFQGLIPLAFLFLTIITMITLSVILHDFPAWRNLIQCILLLIGIVSTIQRQPSIRWHSVHEIAAIFVGLFFTSALIIDHLQNSSYLICHWSKWEIFWTAGLLSAFLDNAPTYMMFFHGLGGAKLAKSIPYAFQVLSISTVYMGALTYIGNGPNLLIRSIAFDHKIKMPSFAQYAGISFVIILPITLLGIWWLI